MTCNDVPEALTFDGALTLRHADALCARLRAALDAHRSIAIGCDEASEIDLSFVQLLLAARRSADAVGKRVTLLSEPAGTLRAALTRGGFAIVPEPGGHWFIGAPA